MVLALTVLLDRLKGLIMQQKIGTPLKCPELNLSPEAQGVELSKDMQQVLSLLTCFVQNKRVVVKGSRSGILYTAPAKLEGMVRITGVGVNDEQVGPDVPCTEVLIIACPMNTGEVYIKPFVVGTAITALPLEQGDSVNWTLDNLNKINLHTVHDGDQVWCCYTM